jgi:hypothetical protein
LAESIHRFSAPYFLLVLSVFIYSIPYLDIFY